MVNHIPLYHSLASLAKFLMEQGWFLVSKFGQLPDLQAWEASENPVLRLEMKYIIYYIPCGKLT